MQLEAILIFLVNRFQFNYMLVVAFTTNDQVYHGFVCLFNFYWFSPGTNYVTGALRTCLLWPKSVKLQQIIPLVNVHEDREFV